MSYNNDVTIRDDPAQFTDASTSSGSYISTAQYNNDFRRILATTQQMQVVAMHVQRRDGNGLGKEVHPFSTQVIQIISGRGTATLFLADGPLVVSLEPGSTLLVPANVAHAIRIGPREDSLRLLTMYAPPVHPPDLAPQQRNIE